MATRIFNRCNGGVHVQRCKDQAKGVGITHRGGARFPHDCARGTKHGRVQGVGDRGDACRAARR